MEAVVTAGAISRAMLQSNHHQQQTNTQFFYRPDAGNQSAEGKLIGCHKEYPALRSVGPTIPKHTKRFLLWERHYETQREQWSAWAKARNVFIP